MMLETSPTAELWNDFITATSEELRRLPLPRIPAEADKFAVILEPRRHPHLEYVMRNMMFFLGSGWGLQVFTSRTNGGYVREIVQDWGHVNIVSMNKDNLTGLEYNRIKKSYDFWRLVKGRVVFWFESDCLLRRPGIDEFTHWDYVGAPWRRDIAISDRIRVGNGGLSIRNREAMLEISRLANTNNGVIYPEDVFFCANMHLSGGRYNVAPLEAAREFAAESMYHPDPIGIHKIWNYLDRSQVRTLLEGIDYNTSLERRTS
jgi:hypothetical protein